jgi:hypothetical protein
MPHPTACLRCNGALEAGFLVDHGDGNYRYTQTWIGGEPEKSFWTGLKTSNRAQYSIRTWRCSRCGLLESYAVDNAATEVSVPGTLFTVD